MIRSDSRDSVAWEKDRRKSPRMAMDRFVYVDMAPGGGGSLVDLGEEGMCVSLATPLASPAEVHFSFTFEGHRTVEGMGRVCWRSQSGQRAGIEFGPLRGDSRKFIRTSLGVGNARTSLMFLPGATKPTAPLSGAEQQAASADRGRADEILRSAAASRPRPTYGGSRLKGILQGAAVCAVLVALGVMIHSYAGTAGKLAWLTPALGTRPASEPVEQAGSRGFTPSAERSMVMMRDWRPGQPIRHTAIFYNPDRNETSFAVEVTGASRERWLARVTNRNLTLSEISDAIPGKKLGSSGNAASPAPSTSQSGSRWQFQGLMGEVLHSDGALVEEGQRPSSASTGHGKSVPEPVVMDAMIGRDGAVRKVQLISSPGSMLASAAVATVRQWRYWPLYENGQAIEFATRITFDFLGAGRQASNE